MVFQSNYDVFFFTHKSLEILDYADKLSSPILFKYNRSATMVVYIIKNVNKAFVRNCFEIEPYKRLIGL